MMNYIWAGMILSGLLAAAVNGRMAQASDALIEGAREAASLLVSLWGGYAMWMGLMRLMQKSGMIRLLARGLRKPVRALMGQMPEAAEEPLLMNMAADMLGLGGAATPFGLQAIREMERANPHSGRATDAECMFLIINASSIQLVPGTVLTLRAAAGSAAAGAVVLPTLLATLCSTAAGILAALVLRRFL